MKKNYLRAALLLCLFVFTASTLWAQTTTGSIKGIIVDSLSKKPQDFITIALKKDKEVIKTVLTEATGNFVFTNIPFGKYTITAIAVGFEPKNMAIDLSASDKTLDLKTILIKSQVNNLSEVAVVGTKPLIKQEVDRISYDIQADPESKILTALDMMRKVPLLSLDADDNVLLKGSGSYKILINNKPSGMLARNPKDVLKSMPATSILKIEVITTPPSKYDSEGLIGIINIITNKNADNGYNGNVNLRHQFPVGGPGIGANFTLKQGRFGLTAYGGSGYYSAGNTIYREFRITTGAVPTSLTAEGTRANKGNNWRYGGAELSYEIDSLNLITGEINPYGGYNKQGSFQHFDLYNGSAYSAYDLDRLSKYTWGGWQGNLNYQLGFKDNKEHLLTFSYRYDRSSEPQDNRILSTNRVNYTVPDYKQHNDNKALEQTIQVDYVHPVKKVKIEAGVKAILRNNDSDFQYLNFNSTLNDYLIDPAQSNTYSNNQNIFGAYNSYAINLNNWNFKAGVRAEGTYVSADFKTTNSTLKTHYFNIIPAVSVNRKFKDNSNLNLGFTQRIQRPGIYDLNPFVDKSNPNYEVYGNPDLKAVLSNNFELTYSSFKKASINLGLSYNFANNTQQTVYIFDPATNITHITQENIGKDRSLTTNININYPITPKFNVSMGGNIGYTWIEGMVSGILSKNKGLIGYGNMNTTYKFENTWKTSFSFNYGAPQVMLQGKSNSYYYLAFSGSKDIIKDKLTLSASAVNPLKKFRAYSNHTEGLNFIQDSYSENYFRRFNVSLNWRFGKLQGSIKKNERSINNDDVKGSGKSG